METEEYETRWLGRTKHRESALRIYLKAFVRLVKEPHRLTAYSQRAEEMATLARELRQTEVSLEAQKRELLQR